MAWWKELFEDTTEAKRFVEIYEKIERIYEDKVENLKQANDDRRQVASLGMGIEVKSRNKRSFSDEDLIKEISYDKQRSEAELDYKNAKNELAQIVGNENVDYIVEHIISGKKIKPEKMAEILKKKAIESMSKEEICYDEDYENR